MSRAQDKGPGTSPRRERRRVALFEIMALIAGVALGIWIILPDLRAERAISEMGWPLLSTFLLGGLALAGPKRHRQLDQPARCAPTLRRVHRYKICTKRFHSMISL